MHLTHARPELPTYVLENGAIVCREPRMISVRVRGLSEPEFLAAYDWAWASLEHFDPEALADATGGVISPARATRAKAMLAAELLTRFGEPRRGELVPRDRLRRGLSETAHDFARVELGAEDRAGIVRVMALMLGTDEVIAGRLADGREQMMER